MRDMKRLASAVLLLGSGMAQAAAPNEDAREGNRAYDARTVHNEAFRAAPSLAQLQGVADLKRAMPDLGVTYDDATGVTRSLVNHVGFLTQEARSGDPQVVAMDWAQAHAGLLGLSPADLAEYRVSRSYVSSLSGVTHLYLQQRVDGIPVHHGVLHVNVARDGRILTVNNQMVPGLTSSVNAARPTLSAAEAVALGAKFVGIAASPREIGARDGAQQAVTLEHAGISQDPIQAKLVYLPVRRGEVRLVWYFGIYTLDSQHWYEMAVDAADGKVWLRYDLVANDSYRVYHRPVEAPTFTTPLPPADGRTLELNPADTTGGNAPSPFGWHDTDGALGAEFTTTQGNNVHAYTDTDANNLPDPGSSPDGGPGLVFDFPIDLTQPPSAYRPAAVTNLFHWSNLIHDIQYRYGFDEASGNFQTNNYGRGGTGNDSLQAEAQDGSGTNGANIAVPADGLRPRLHAFIWTPPTPDVDASFDNGVTVHEYGHGISLRQVGTSVSCLQNMQQPGEGISDVLALMYTGEAGDAGTDGRGIGTYLLGQPPTGPGIRTLRYSTDPAINPWTYASMAGMAVPHGVGSVWAQGYWEVYWKLVDDYGFGPNLPDATGGFGNQRAMAYFNEGLQNAICSPAFTDVRDSIIAATVAINAGADTCRVWSAFAPFGLGTNAVSGGPNSTTPTNGFQVPVSCQIAAPSGLVATAGGANQINLTWTAAPGAASYRVYRANGTCPQASYVQIATGVAGPAYTDNTVSGGNTYSYVVTQVDGASNESGFSNCDDASATGGCSTPPTFAGLASVAGAPGSCRLDLSWAPGTTGCGGTTLVYNVYRSTTPGFTPAPSNLRTSCLSGTTFSDTPVTSGTTYHYVVQAEDSTTSGNGSCNHGNQETNLVYGSGTPACTGLIRGDFNSDGKTDILWRHDESGENVLWYMNGVVLAGGEFTTPPALVDVRWKMVGTHDFNADNENDILWRHNVAGENVLWYMNGSVLTSGEFLTPAALADTNWQMAGTGDFNGDGKPDIAWHHQTAAQIVVWFMNGSVLESGTFTSPSTMDVNYRLVGVADFSNPLDGKPDFVWRHSTTGANLFWLMNGINQTASVPTSTLSDTGWALVATGDFNQDNKNDFVWRHQTSGQNVAWFMNGTEFVGGTFTTPAEFPDTRWKMVGPR